jgi:hypothetical protein
MFKSFKSFIPSFILPRDAGEERGEGLDVLNDWNDLNRRINKRP